MASIIKYIYIMILYSNFQFDFMLWSTIVSYIYNDEIPNSVSEKQKKCVSRLKELGGSLRLATG